jgi:hypothetical protein
VAQPITIITAFADYLTIINHVNYKYSISTKSVEKVYEPKLKMVTEIYTNKKFMETMKSKSTCI